MAFHLRRQLRHAIATALDGLGAHVFPGRTWPTEDRHYPAILIYAHGGTSQFDNLAATDSAIPLEREERVTVEAIVKTRNSEPDDALDDLAALIEPLMMTDTGIAALVDRRELVSTDISTRSGPDGREGSIKLTYRMVFATTAGNPSARI